MAQRTDPLKAPPDKAYSALTQKKFMKTLVKTFRNQGIMVSRDQLMCSWF
jgi:hypothetical protein